MEAIRESGDQCGCQYDAAGRRFRLRCIRPPPMTAEQTLRGVAGLGGDIGNAVHGLLAERDRLAAEVESLRAQLQGERDTYAEQLVTDRAAYGTVRAEFESLRAAEARVRKVCRAQLVATPGARPVLIPTADVLAALDGETDHG